MVLPRSVNHPENPGGTLSLLRVHVVSVYCLRLEKWVTQILHIMNSQVFIILCCKLVLFGTLYNMETFSCRFHHKSFNSYQLKPRLRVDEVNRNSRSQDFQFFP